MDHKYLYKGKGCLEEKPLKMDDYLRELSFLEVHEINEIGKYTDNGDDDGDGDGDGDGDVNSDSDTVKVVTLPPISPSKEKRLKKNHDEKPPPKKRDRVITKTKQWLSQIDNTELTIEKQWQWLQEWKVYLDGSEIGSTRIDPGVPREMPKCKLGIRQISIKLDGYKKQDIEKKKWDSEEFVDLMYVIDLLVESRLICFYCKEHVKILYKEVRDPKQWTLERIDNAIGHNRKNVEIACLSCNVRRRTMYYEKYRFTKQLKIEKAD